MFGVCKAWNDWGGGGGYYEGGVCRSYHLWWTGSTWSGEPVNEGPFATREEAQAFAAQERARSGKWCYDYGAGDPYGCSEEYYHKPEGILPQLDEPEAEDC